MHWRFGATLGEQAVGLRVMDLAEKPVTFRQAVARDAISLAQGAYSDALIVSMILAGQTVTSKTPGSLDTGTASYWMDSALLLAEIVVVLLSAKRRSIGDLIAGTVVVRENVPLGSAAQPAPSP